MENEVQMQINLNKSAGNDFRQALRNGEFIFLSEALIPPGEKELAKLGERIVPFAEKMWSFTDLHGGVAVPDHFDAAWSAADIAAVFPREQRSKNIFFTSVPVHLLQAQEGYRQVLSPQSQKLPPSC